MVKVRSTLKAEQTAEANKIMLKKLNPLMIVISLLFIVIGLLNFNEDNSYSIFCIVFGVLFFPMLWLISKISQKSLNKSASLLKGDTVLEFEFDEYGYVMTCKKGDDYEEHTKAKYSFIYKIDETEKSYFLWISKAQMLPFYKSDIVEGSEEELTQIFKLNLGKKFNGYKNKK